jgi:putative addiction module killer protein
MLTVQRTPEFERWLGRVRDREGVGRILKRLQRLARGNAGDVQPIGEGISELRLHFGPGYRVYFRQRGDAIVLLYGGDKDSQEQDIRMAQALARELED